MTAKNEETNVHVDINWERDLIFKLNFSGIKVPGMLVDETNKDDENIIGVTPGRLVASAVGSCLSSSLLFCMSKRNVSFKAFHAEAEAITGRDPDDRLRIQKINVTLFPETDEPGARKRLAECKKVFEKFCTVTESVRKGIEVNVEIKEA